MSHRPIKKYLFLILAHGAVLLAFLGLFLPILPTTPLLLLAAYLYLRSSKKMYSWLMNHALFGSILYDYMTHRSVKMKHKIIAYGFLWLGLGSSMWLVQNLLIKGLLMIIGLGVTYHIYGLQTRVFDETKDKTEVNWLED